MLQSPHKITFKDIEAERKEKETKEAIEKAFTIESALDKIKVSFDWKKTSVKIAASVISFAASYMSMFYTYSWFSLRLEVFQALCMTIIIVGAILVIPQMATMFLHRKGVKAKAAAFGLAIIMVVSASFSMMTTIGTLYNKQSSQSIQSSENLQKKEAIQSGVEARKSKRERLEQSIDVAARDEARYTERIDALLSQGVVTGSEMSSLVANRNKAQNARNKAEEEISILIGQEETFSIEASKISAERPDFISWIAGRFEINRDWAELLMNAIPAIFVDVLAPSMLMVVLFL